MAQPEPKVKLLHSNESENIIRSLMLRDMGMIYYNYRVSNEHVLKSVAETNLVHKKSHIDKEYELPGIPTRSSFLMVYSSSGTKMASAHGNHLVYINDVATRKNYYMLRGHPRTPWCIAYHPCFEHILASGCLDGLVKIWDLKSGDSIKTAKFSSVIASIAFHPFQQLLIIATGNRILFWDWSQPEPLLSIETSAPQQKVRFVAFDHFGKKLITGIGNPKTNEPYSVPLVTSTIFNRIRFTSVSDIPGTSREILDPDMPFNPSDRIIAHLDLRSRRERNWVSFEEEGDEDIGQVTYRVQAWDFTDGQLPDIKDPEKNIVIPKCRIHNDGSIDISPDGTVLATTFENAAGMYSLQWETLGAEICRTDINEHVLSVSISPTQQYLMVGLANTRYAENYVMANIYQLVHSHAVMEEEEGSNVIRYNKKVMNLVQVLRGQEMWPKPTSLNCIKWSPTPGLGIVYATNQGRLAILQ